MCKRWLTALIMTLVIGTTPAVADLDATIKTCNGCHGENGVSRWNDVPTIAGIDAFVHSDALYLYRDEARPCAMSEFRCGDTGQAATTMCDVTADMSDDDIEAIAEHYAELPFVAAEQEFDAGLAEAGQAIHERDCGVCHSDGGSNPDDEASIIAGQWMGYLETTFTQYKAGEREQPQKMQEKIDALSADDVKALLHFYASQQ